MEYEGYEVRWDHHKYILFTTPEGKSCRDRSLHDETYLKENLKKLFAYRADHGFTPLTSEPPEGWFGQIEQAGNLANGIISLGKNLESTANVPPPITPKTWTESKQRQREALKKLAQGHIRKHKRRRANMAEQNIFSGLPRYWFAAQCH